MIIGPSHLGGRGGYRGRLERLRGGCSFLDINPSTSQSGLSRRVVHIRIACHSMGRFHASHVRNPFGTNQLVSGWSRAGVSTTYRRRHASSFFQLPDVPCRQCSGSGNGLPLALSIDSAILSTRSRRSHQAAFAAEVAAADDDPQLVTAKANDPKFMERLFTEDALGLDEVNAIGQPLFQPLEPPPERVAVEYPSPFPVDMKKCQEIAEQTYKVPDSIHSKMQRLVGQVGYGAGGELQLMEDYRTPSLLFSDLTNTRMWTCPFASAGEIIEGSVHPQLEFRDIHHRVHVHLEDKSAFHGPEVLWDAVYDMGGTEYLPDNAFPLGGTQQDFRKLCPPLNGPPHWYELTVSREGNGGRPVMTDDFIAAQVVTAYRPDQDPVLAPYIVGREADDDVDVDDAAVGKFLGSEKGSSLFGNLMSKAMGGSTKVA